MHGVTRLIGWGLGLVVVGVSAPAFAADWYVDASAGAGGNGNLATPFRALQEGVDAAMPGDTVHVAPGTYGPMQSVRNGNDGARITIAATEPREAIVEADGTAFEVSHSHYTVEGLVLDCDYGSGDCIEGGGSDSLELIDLEVRRSARDCIDLRNSNGVLIEATDIHHCIAQFDPNNNADAHGITGDSVFDLTVRDCTILLVTGDAIQLSPSRDPWDNLLVESSVLGAEPLGESINGWAAGTVIGENAFDSKVGSGNPSAVFRDVVAYGWRGPINNAAAFNAKEEVDFVAERVRVYDSEIAFRLRGPARATIHNAVVFDVDVGFRFEDDLSAPRIYNTTVGRAVERTFTEAGGGANGLDVRNVLFLASEVPDLAADEASNMAVGDSVFVDASSDDYHLVEGSEPMDAGVDIADIVVDFDGVGRPFGDAFDVGAYEWTDMPPPSDTDGTNSTDTAGGDGDGSDGGDGGSGDSDGNSGGDANGGSAGSSGGDTDTDDASSGGGAGLGEGGETGCSCRSTVPRDAGGLWILLIAGAMFRCRRKAAMTGTL